MHEVMNQQFLVQFFFKVKLVAFGLIFIDSHFGHYFAIIFVKSVFFLQHVFLFFLIVTHA